MLTEIEPTPIALVTVSSSKDQAVLDESHLLDITLSTLSLPSGFDLIPESTVHRQCGERLQCIAQELYALHAERWSRSDAGRYVVILSRLVRAGSPDLVSLSLLDAKLARHLFRESDVLEKAILLSHHPKLIENEAQLQQYLETARPRIHEILQERGHRSTFGRLIIEPSDPSAELFVYLDDTLIGPAAGRKITIDAIKPGLRSLTLHRGNTPVFNTSVEIKQHQTVRVTPSVEWPEGPFASLRSVLMWSGWTAAILGAGLASYGAYAQTSSETTSFLASPSNRPSGLFFEFDLVDSPSPNRLLPIGVGLASAGVSLGLGILLSDDEKPPWWPIITGTLVGGSLFAIAWGLQ